MRKILLHGAVNTSNFGDVLFVNLFFNKLRKEKIDIGFLENKFNGISSFNSDEIKYKNHGKKYYKEADTLIFISGGYFGDNKKNLLASLYRWFRYFKIGLYFARKKRAIYILGVGGAPLFHYFNRRAAIKIINKACYVTVRDDKTKEYFDDLGAKTNIIVTADTALTLKKEDLPELNNALLRECSKKNNLIFLHLTGNEETDDKICKTIIPSLIDFIQHHDDYKVVLSFDNVMNKKITETRAFSLLCDYGCMSFDYKSSMQLCALIANCKLVITCKLHVGIVGCVLNKSVLSFPIHKFKTSRFYEKIGYIDRCKPLSESSNDIVLNQLNQFYDSPIYINKEIIDLAKSNLSILEELNDD